MVKLSYVIRATLNNTKHPEYGEAAIPFPLSGDEYVHSTNEVLIPLGIGDAISQDCTIESIDSNYEILQCLKGQTVNVDELDYLAKRLDSFCDIEADAFQAASYAFRCKDIKALINMTFCCREATVISDFSKLEEAGKSHYLAVHQGAVTMDDLQKVDGRNLARSIIESGNGVPTPYGLFFRNNMKREKLYQGMGFPPYVWDERLAEVDIEKTDGSVASLYLPATTLKVERFFKRERISNLSNCKVRLVPFFGLTESITLSGGKVELQKWNDLCASIKAMPDDVREVFYAALEVTGAKDLAQMQLLVSNIDDFDLIPGVTDAESYGKYMIRHTGKYYYDDTLDCYYNYEAFGDFLMIHEIGKVTKYGYLKCEEDSVFLDFFTQEGPKQQGHQEKKNEMRMEMEGV